MIVPGVGASAFAGQLFEPLFPLQNRIVHESPFGLWTLDLGLAARRNGTLFATGEKDRTP